MATRCLRQPIITGYLVLKDTSRRDLGKMGILRYQDPPPPMAILDFVDKITKATYRQVQDR